MTNEKLRNLVTAAVSLDREIADKTDQLKLLKEQITAEAETRAEEATPTEGGGTSLIFEGADGCVARVTTTAASLKGAIKQDDKKLDKIKEAARAFFSRLFIPEVVLKPVTNFRDKAVNYLGPKDAAKLIKLCESAGRTSVSFETKEAAES
jgi:hypothetical protein